MSVFIGDSLLFLHTPKTGGSWVTHILRNNVPGYTVFANKHATWEDLHALRERADIPCRPAYAKVVAAFVRHPLAWYESYWRFRGGSASPDDGWNTHYGRQPHILDPIDRCGHPNFAKFLERCIQVAPEFVSMMYDEYTREACFIGKQERLVEDTAAMLVTAGLLTESAKWALENTPGINVSKQAPPAWRYVPGNLIGKLLDLEDDALQRYSYGALEGPWA